MAKLTKAQIELLWMVVDPRIMRSDAGISRNWRATGDKLVHLGFLEVSMSGYGGLYRITPAGRAALAKNVEG